MRKILAFSLALVISIPGCVSFAGDTSNMQMAYLLNEESGDRNDESSNNLDLTDNNTVLFATGQFGNAALFASANSESLERADPNEVELGSGNFTIAFWNNNTTVSDTQLYHIWKGGGFGNGWAAVIEANAGADGTMTLYFDAGAAAAVTNAATDAVAAWHHFCLQFDDTADTLDWRIDDAATETDAVAANPTANATNFFMGSAGANGRYINAAMDDTVIFTRKLTNAECSELYSSGLSAYITGTATVASTSKNLGVGFIGSGIGIFTIIHSRLNYFSLVNKHREKFGLPRPFWMKLLW